MRVLMTCYKVKAEYAIEVEAGLGRLFAAIQQAQLDGFRISSCHLADGVSYVSLVEIEDGVANPLPSLPEYRAFQENTKTWIAEPSTTEQLTVSGTYRLFKG